ncbi:uncharacterized protein EI97DRAFT_438300 [Westerdykella ornata]|uniref:MARVEL domain-containing protein n=1 Tax=Westerdykella ornata TaxID=318751 RepID=A0A6A6JW88_WESOR|nr:uncharacterized protein EI97DRAFT_438300 [Westerdykella ornata]KAF2280871.1 hypothetical protein EI97DRAFT_438300 [Westerdykella ornata]
MYGLKGGTVAIPSWILIFRWGQLFFAILALAMCAYSLSVYGGGPLQPPLISTIIISGLTLVPILLFTTPLHLAQRKMYDPRIALLMDGFAALYWLATFAALASYQHIFRDWGRRFDRFVFAEAEVCWECRRAWRTGLAATVFSAVNFVLFTLTTLAFLYYYHFHNAGVPAPGIRHSDRGAAAEAAMSDKYSGTSPTTTTTTTAGAAGFAHLQSHHPGQNIDNRYDQYAGPGAGPYEQSGGYGAGSYRNEGLGVGEVPQRHVQPPLSPNKREEGEMEDVPTPAVGAGGDRCGG